MNHSSTHRPETTECLRHAVSRVRTTGWMALVVALLSLLIARPGEAVVITSTTSPSISNPASVFDVSHTGNSYSLGANTTFNPAGFDLRDLFGGQYDTYLPELGNVIFADSSPIHTVETVNVTLASAVSLTSFSLWAAEDGNGTGNRSMSEFRLYTGSTLLTDVQVLDNTGTQTYTNVYGSPQILIQGTLTGAPVASSYTLEFIQNQPANSVSGLRLNEFQAFVPEPGGLPFLLASTLLAMASTRATRKRQTTRS